jgi:hypothetical protein
MKSWVIDDDVGFALQSRFVGNTVRSLIMRPESTRPFLAEFMRSCAGDISWYAHADQTITTHINQI